MRRATAVLAALAVAISAAIIAGPVTAQEPTDPPSLRVIMQYPWHPETEAPEFTHYTPALGKMYDSSNRTINAVHAQMIDRAGFDVSVLSWWGRGTKTDGRIDGILEAAREVAPDLRYTLYYEMEGTTDPSVAELDADLDYIASQYAGQANYLRRGGKPVLFVYGGESCAGVARWNDANAGRFYTVMKVFGGYQDCAEQPSSWHQYGPATPRSQHPPYSNNVSPGFWHVDEAAPRLERDLTRFKADVAAMDDANVEWKIITSLNEWGEGTAVEPASEWQSPSGQGDYLDAIRDVFVNHWRPDPVEPDPTPDPTPEPVTRTITVTASADTWVRQSDPTATNGNAGTLWVDMSSTSRDTTYLKFDVAGINADEHVVDAKLRLTARDANGPTSNGPAVYPVGTGWTEAMTWANRPARTGGQVGNIGDAPLGPTNAAISGITGNGTVAFELDAESTNGYLIESREASAAGDRPQLILTVSNGEGGTTNPPPDPGASDATVMAVGDIACQPGSTNWNGGQGTSSGCRHMQVSQLVVDENPDRFLALGDNQYECGELANYQQAYDPSFGRFKAKTIPAIGNHEYQSSSSQPKCLANTPSGGEGHFRYFGWELASPRDPGCVRSPDCTAYWSEQIGAWHVVVLNSNCSKVGGCGSGSPQEQWLRQDLAADQSQCTLAITHHPRWSSGQHGDNGPGSSNDISALYRALQADHADLLLSGHDHDYERFAAKLDNGTVDPSGVVQFVVGGGGKNRYSMESNPVHAGSQVRDDDSFGVLRLQLHADGYDWRYVIESTKDATPLVDAGSAACH